MFEVLTQVLILVGLYFLIRYVLLSFIPRAYLTWLGGIILVLILLWALLEPTNQAISIAWSILSFPLRPLGLVLILLITALGGGIKKADTNRILWATVILLICSLPLTAYLLTAQTEQRSVLESIDRRTDTATDLGNVQAIVTLGEGYLPTDPSYRIRMQINDVTNGTPVPLASRLVYTARLYEEQTARGSEPLVLINSGADSATAAAEGQTDPNSTSAALLTQLGVSSDVIQFLNGVDVRTSAIATQQQFISLGFTGQPRIILVAPALAIRRATSAFRNVGFDVIPRPTDFYVFQVQGGLRFAAITDLIPSAEALVVTSRVVDEYLATIYYFLRGWLIDPLGL